MICALCREKEANKKNTHFLTDGIIRSSLNLDGSKGREKGFYFDLSTKNPFIEFNFQRATPVDPIEDSLGRQLTETEIANAQNIPFSVDNVFCSQCEANFTKIESDFLANILPKFRNSDLSSTNRLSIDNFKLVRLFFYLQIWRTAICDSTVKLSENVAEDLRKVILNSESIKGENINHYPLLVTYLETLEGDQEYTTNTVGYSNDINPTLIFMNDFIIQFYQSLEDLKYFDFYGLNSEADYKTYSNFKEQSFLFHIIHNLERKKLINDYLISNRVKKTIEFYTFLLANSWQIFFNEPSTKETINSFLKILIPTSEFNILQYSRETVLESMQTFIQKELKNRSGN